MVATPNLTPKKTGSVLTTPPIKSPSSKRIYGDRFIPCRSGNSWHADFRYAQIKSSAISQVMESVCSGNNGGNNNNSASSSPSSTPSSSVDQLTNNRNDYALVYSSLLQNEILGSKIEDYKELLSTSHLNQHCCSHTTSSTCSASSSLMTRGAVGSMVSSGGSGVGGANGSFSSNRLSHHKSPCGKDMSCIVGRSRSTGGGDSSAGEHHHTPPSSHIHKGSGACCPSMGASSSNSVLSSNSSSPHVNRNLFSFTPSNSPLKSSSGSGGLSGSGHVGCGGGENLASIERRKAIYDASIFSLSPVSVQSQMLLASPKKSARKISKIPFKVLDAPELQDDFYLNLVDWSSQNVLAVGLGACVYLWSASTSQVTKLCDLTTPTPSTHDTVTSVSWSERGNLVAVGTNRGLVQVWDVSASKRINVLDGHSARVGALAWGNGDLLCSGSRDRMILQRDVVRSPPYTPVRKLVGHRQEVCGLRFSPDNQHLASGGNDNRLFVWSLAAASSDTSGAATTAPLQTYSDHIAAVKAIAWSPHQHGLLASGGGTADRCIRFWNTLTGQAMQSIDTGSQVCNLAWSKHASELVSTHGYSQNQIVVWKYPSLTQVAKLTGHSYRVLYLAVSPEGEAIVTGAGDETLRFWNVFSKVRSQKESKSVLNLFSSIR